MIARVKSSVEMDERRDRSNYLEASSGIRNALAARTNKGSHTTPERSEDLYEFNNFAANAIDYPVDSILSGSEWLEYKCDDPDLAEYIRKRLEGIREYLGQALKTARLIGGAGIFIGAMDGQAQDKPVNLLTLKEVQFFNVLEGGVNGELKIDELNDDPTSPDFGEPLYYKIKQVRIHASRVIPFYGIRPLTKRRKALYSNWGIPILARAIDKLERLEIADSAIAATLPNFSRLIYEIEDLPTMLATKQGREKLRARVEEISYCWTVLGILPVSAGKEAISNISYDYSGLKELLGHFKLQLAGSIDIPHTRLYGESPSGVTSGSSEQDDWQDYCSDLKGRTLKKPALRLAKYFASELINPYRGEAVGEEINFPKINRITPKEQAEIDLKQAQTAKIYQDTGVLTPEGIAEALQKGLPLGSAVDLKAIQQDTELARSLAAENDIRIDPADEEVDADA
jgi:uncharacterized protein